MRCTSPRTVGFYDDGKTLCWSPKKYSKEYPTFQLPCSKCIACRLEYSRQWAIRCIHEAQMHPENSFITLTYDDKNLESDKLIYIHFQKFMKRLRRAFPNQQIGCFVTGEYGEQRKRPHWHALIFNWRPSDAIYKYSNERGDKVFSSETLQRLWPYGICEVGSLTFESAGYCARYAAKKLVHGHDKQHPFQPISRKSSKHAIGKSYLELFWRDVFSLGYCLIKKADGSIVESSIPRYYEKWLLKTHPAEWIRYVTQKKQRLIEEVTRKEEEKKQQVYLANMSRPAGSGPQVTENEARAKILEQKFNKLQSHLKL